MAKKKKEIMVEGIAMIVKLSDGTFRQVFITKEEQGIWLGLLNNFYNPIKIMETKLEGITFTP